MLAPIRSSYLQFRRQFIFFKYTFYFLLSVDELKKTGLKIAGRFFGARWERLDVPLVEKPEARRGGITPGLLISNWLVTHCLVPHSGISVLLRDSLRPFERAEPSGDAAYVTGAAAAQVGPAEPGAQGDDGDDEDGDRQTKSLAKKKKSHHLEGKKTEKKLETVALTGNTNMEGHAFPDQQQLLHFLRRLKEVFDVCDEDADGFIRVEHLEHLGVQFGQGDEVSPPAGISTVGLTHRLLACPDRPLRCQFGAEPPANKW